MKLSLVLDQAIAARMALIVGADNFDRLFRGIQFHEFDGKVLYVYAADDYRAAEIEACSPYTSRLLRPSFSNEKFPL